MTPFLRSVGQETRMSMANLNDLFVLSCIAVITAAPFFFRFWLKRYPMRTLESIDQTTSRLSIVIFVALFAGAFVFGQRSAKIAEVLLGAAILSFSILYQSRFRYLVNQNLVDRTTGVNAKPTRGTQSARNSRNAQSARKVDLVGLSRKFTLFAFAVSFAFLVSKFPVMLASLLLYPYFMPYLVRFKYAATVMNESDLKDEFKNRFKKAGTKVHEIYLIDSETYTRNAMMVGSSLFITLDLFQKLNDAEMTAVISHEASHLQKRHSLKRVAGSFGAFVLVSYWIFLPTTLAFMGSQAAVFLAVPFLILANNFFLGKIIRRQEMEADLGAIELGASSDALISALHQLSPPGKSKTVPLSTRLVFGNYHPSTEEREAVIRAGSIPKNAYFQHKKYAYAYSLLVLGYTFHVANQLSLTESTRNPATISHVETVSTSR
jgi:Zn-dependent protease with chaperone function